MVNSVVVVAVAASFVVFVSLLVKEEVCLYQRVLLH